MYWSCVTVFPVFPEKPPGGHSRDVWEEVRQVLNVILHQFFVYNELGGKFCDSNRCINWQLPLLEELLNIWSWLPNIGNTLLAIFIIIGRSMNAQVLKIQEVQSGLEHTMTHPQSSWNSLLAHPFSLKKIGLAHPMIPPPTPPPQNTHTYK